MKLTKIKTNVESILNVLPPGVEVVAAVKSRTIKEVIEAVEAGIRVVGENYLQSALDLRERLPREVKLHFIGHLQRNKVKKAVKIFDMIETVDSLDTAVEIGKRCREIAITMPILVEVNSARESSKNGVFPENVFDLIDKISEVDNIMVKGLMTMGPAGEDPDSIREAFRNTKKLFDSISSMKMEKVEMDLLSMGMSDSFQIAIQEGANMVRIGTSIFGPR